MDQVTIMVSETPNILANVEMEEVHLCDDDQVMLSATNPTIGTGVWTTNSNASIITPNNATTSAEDFSTGASMFIWSLSHEACLNYDADTMVVFSEEAIQVTDDAYVINLNERIVDEDLLINDIIGFVNEVEINITQEPTLGTVEMVDGIFTYTPDNNAFGLDQFEYEICNANCPNTCETAVVTITLNGLTEKGECWIPNVLTPNGNGKNDALIIPCTEQYPDNELMVFNRWGDKVFATERYQNDWEGTFNGNDLPAGTYYYIFKQGEDNVDPIQGFFTIMR
jgi:gliding motility-associated-like protein